MRQTENPMTIQQFLNKLPASVVKNGKLIGVRNDIGDMLKETARGSGEEGMANTRKTVLVETSTLSEIQRHHPDMSHEQLVKQSVVVDGGGRDKQPLIDGADDDHAQPVATLKIRQLNRDTGCLLIKLKYSETIQTVKEYIRSHW